MERLYGGEGGVCAGVENAVKTKRVCTLKKRKRKANGNRNGKERDRDRLAL